MMFRLATTLVLALDLSARGQDAPTEDIANPDVDTVNPDVGDAGEPELVDTPVPFDDTAPDAPQAEDAPTPAAPIVRDVPQAQAQAPASSDAATPPPPPSAVPSAEAIARDSSVDLSKSTRRDRFKRPGTPQRFAFEFKIGPYLPDVDKDYRGPGLGPYAEVFGRTNDAGLAVAEPRLGVMPILGFEWQYWYLAGPLTLGTQVGFFRDTAKALYATPDSSGELRSEADTTAFGMVPVALLLGYRFEYLADRFRVPLVPYGKVGPTYTFWWTTGGNGSLSRNADGDKGVGGVWGWQVNAGLMLRLDFLEPTTARRLDQATGINHTFLFGEFHYGQANNFGVGQTLNLGDLTGFAGIGIEF